MKICKNCKAELEDNQNFCYRCGSNEFEKSENIVSENAERISVKTKNKKKLLKIIIPIVAVVLLIVGALATVSIVNYNNLRPYREILEQLESNRFIYYQECDEISCINFEKTDYNSTSNFFEKLLNIKETCVIYSRTIYHLYDKDAVEDNEALYDLIKEAEDGIPYSSELVIDDNGEARLVFYDQTDFNINLDNDKIVSVTYSEDEKEYKNGSIDTQLGDKYTSIINEYTDYMAKNDDVADVFTVAQYVSLASELDIAVNGSGFILDINDFIDRCYDNPEIKVEADRTENNLYYITVSGYCSYYDNHWFVNPFYTRDATVVFCYDGNENDCWVERDDDNAFHLYHAAKLN